MVSHRFNESHCSCEVEVPPAESPVVSHGHLPLNSFSVKRPVCMSKSPANKKSSYQKRTSSRSSPYPFSAIVGQDEMKLALILSAIDPHIGGVLIMGHRGTGKSTAVRALADLLPPMKVVVDCVFGCDPGDERNLCASCSRRARLGTTRKAVPIVD